MQKNGVFIQKKLQDFKRRTKMSQFFCLLHTQILSALQRAENNRSAASSAHNRRKLLRCHKYIFLARCPMVGVQGGYSVSRSPVRAVDVCCSLSSCCHMHVCTLAHICTIKAQPLLSIIIALLVPLIWPFLVYITSYINQISRSTSACAIPPPEGRKSSS